MDGPLPPPCRPTWRLQETRQLVSRASAVADPNSTCALIAPRFLSEWENLAHDLPSHNLLLHPVDSPPLSGITRVLQAIQARDADASVVLIPADHCAAIESAWVKSAQGALDLARQHRNTVYLLHDQPKEAPRAFEAAHDLCSTTVIVGSAASLFQLCQGNRSTRVQDLLTDDCSAPASDPAPAAKPTITVDDSDSPINLVHVRLVEEYERIQRGRYSLLPQSQINVTV